ncbi:MAG: S8 family serine peptidase [Flavobacteriales bacterium]|nr:S8 family serine peptidase [Flavobacteriales bacterium]
MRKSMSALFVLGMVISLSSVGQTSDLWKSKVDQSLFSQTTAEQIPFMVVMKEQADVSGAYQLKTKEEKGAYVYHLLKETAERSQQALRKELDDAGITYQSFFMVNTILVHGNMETLEKIASRADVQAVVENMELANHKPVEEIPDVSNKSPNAVEWGISMINADDVWALGYKGQNVVVGGADVGVDWDHPAIKNQYRGWNGSSANHDYSWFDAVKNSPGSPSCGYNSPEPCGDGSHGTHTIGTICGDDGGGNQIGVAPEATWIAARNMDDGVGTLSLYVSCFEWFLAPTKLNGSGADPAKAPHVINNSWGCLTDEGCNTSNYNTMETAVLNCRAAGIVVVVSAGNDGSGCNTIGNPAIFEGSFAVGSSTSADDISSFSSRGAASSGGVTRVKPDVTAPGSSIRSAADGGGYTTMSGTSMAGPHVAGAVALLISANPSLAGQVDSIEAVLKRTAVRKTSSQTCSGTPGSSIPNNTWGWGRINILEAVQEVVQKAPVAEFTNDASTGCNSLTVNFTDKSTFSPTSWLWDFGDGSTSSLANPSHTYGNPGNYSVTLTATNGVGNDNITKTDLIKVGVGNPLPTQFGGAADNTIGDGAMHANEGFGLFFDAQKDVVIQSLKVYAGSAGTREIAVLDGEGGNVISSKSVNLTAGEQRVTVELDVPTGNGRFIQCIGTTDLYRNSTGPAYPYNIGSLVSITESNAGSAGYYYYFYDWEVREVGCDGTTGIFEEETLMPFRIIPNPNNGNFSLSVPDTDPGTSVQVDIYDILGQSVFSTQAGNGERLNVTLRPGIYHAMIHNGKKYGIQKLVIQ